MKNYAASVLTLMLVLSAFPALAYEDPDETTSTAVPAQEGSSERRLEEDRKKLYGDTDRRALIDENKEERRSLFEENKGERRTLIGSSTPAERRALFSENSKERRALFLENSGERHDLIKQEWEERRARFASSTDMWKSRFASSTKERIANRADHVADLLDAMLVRLHGISDRIATRIEELSAAGEDTSEAEAALEDADDALALAEDAVEAVKAAMGTALASETPKEEAKETVKPLIEASKKALRVAHEELIGAVRTLPHKN